MYFCCEKFKAIQQFQFHFQKVVYIATLLFYLSDGITQYHDNQQLLYFLLVMEFRTLGIPTNLCSYDVVN